MWPFIRKKHQDVADEDKWKIVGVTMGWNLKPTLMFTGGYILWGGADRIRFPEYYQHGDWPTDPVTGEKLPIAK